MGKYEVYFGNGAWLAQLLTGQHRVIPACSMSDSCLAFLSLSSREIWRSFTLFFSPPSSCCPSLFPLKLCNGLSNLLLLKEIDKRQSSPHENKKRHKKRKRRLCEFLSSERGLHPSLILYYLLHSTSQITSQTEQNKKYAEKNKSWYQRGGCCFERNTTSETFIFFTSPFLQQYTEEGASSFN